MREQARVNGPDTKRTLGIGGALEVGDICLLEDGSECGGTLVSDAVAVETVPREDGDGERASVSTGSDTKANSGRGDQDAVAGKQAGLSVLRAWSLQHT